MPKAREALKMFWCQQHVHCFRSKIKKPFHRTVLGRALQEFQTQTGVACKAAEYKLDQRMEESLIYVPFNAKKEEIAMRSAKFRKCAELSKTNSGLHRFSLNWDFAMGIMNCVLPVHYLQSISWLSQQIELSNQYLSSQEFLFLVFVGRHYLLSAFKVWQNSSKMARPLSVQEINNHPSCVSSSWIARYWYWKFPDSFNVVQLLTLLKLQFAVLESRTWRRNNLSLLQPSG